MHRLFAIIYTIIMTECALLAQTNSQSDYHYTTIVATPDLSFYSNMLTGLDVLEQMDFAPLRGKSIAVLTNRTAVDRSGNHVLHLLAEQDSIYVKFIFEPQYGAAGVDDERLTLNSKEDIDPVTGARILDLFWTYVIPPRWIMKAIDLILVDIQDTGVRYSTYITTLTKIFEVAREYKAPILLLDRPNPLRGDVVNGPVIRTRYQSFEGYHIVPIRHGLTLGEYALIVNELGWAKDMSQVDLRIIPVQNWDRTLWYNETGLPWIPPEPTLISPEALLGYTGMGLFKATNVNAGQGTRNPWLRIGAPWIRGQELAGALAKFDLKGVQLNAVTYKPLKRDEQSTVPPHVNQVCSGIDIIITDRDAFEPIAAATIILLTIKQLYPQEFQWVRDDYAEKLFGSPLLRTFAAQGKRPDYLPPQWTRDVIRFNEFRQPFLLYE